MPGFRATGRSPSVMSRAIALRAALVLAVLVSACSPSSGEVRFDPASPCATDGRFSGAYPALEALLPTTFGGKAPASIDSGRNCTATNLTTLLSNHGLHEVHFAGAVWTDSVQSGITMSVWQAPGLAADWIGEWYEANAYAARSTSSITPSRPMVQGRQGYRLDVVNNEAKQSVITWPSASGDAVQVVLASDEPEARIQDAVAAFR